MLHNLGIYIYQRLTTLFMIRRMRRPSHCHESGMSAGVGWALWLTDISGNKAEHLLVVYQCEVWLNQSCKLPDSCNSSQTTTTRLWCFSYSYNQTMVPYRQTAQNKLWWLTDSYKQSVVKLCCIREIHNQLWWLINSYKQAVVPYRQLKPYSQLQLCRGFLKPATIKL